MGAWRQSSQRMMQIRVEMEAELQKRPCDGETSGARGLFLASRTMCHVHPVCPVQCQLPPATVDLSLSTCRSQLIAVDLSLSLVVQLSGAQTG